MKKPRREFLAGLGATFAGLVLTRCFPTCYAPVPTPYTGSGDWKRLYEVWNSLDLLARDAKTVEKGEQTRDRLVKEHRAALDQLVSSGILDANVADDLQVAFGGAAYHVWRSNSPITCYAPRQGPDYQTESNVGLASQAKLLTEMAEKSQIDANTVELARTGIARDLALLSLSQEDQRAIRDRVMQAAGQNGPFPDISALGLEVPADCTEAARVLVELLLGQK